MKDIKPKAFVATRNACKLCTPLGASVVFKGVEGCVPLIHGSQGCATYIRRYLISHYKEPVDIASTNFTEQSAIFGGQQNLFVALNNIINQYDPKVIGIATTCLSETIGDDMQVILHKYKNSKSGEDLPELVYVNTPSFKGTHANGFHDAVAALVRQFAPLSEASQTTQKITFLPGYLSTADLRVLKEILVELKLENIFLPDYSNTLDYEYNGKYMRIPEGGTTVDEIKETGSSRATIELGYILSGSDTKAKSAGEYLEEEHSVPRFNLGLPIGINATDEMFETLEKLSGNPMPERYKKQRGRLVDAYVDGHKYVFGKRAVVYGEEDFVVGMVKFLEEIGIETVLCASGGGSGLLKQTIYEKVKPSNDIIVHDNFDYEDIASSCRELKPDIMIGNSKGYYIARELDIPLVRIGFPVHDRIGGQRIKHVSYEGTQELFDKMANALIQYTQDNSPVGYKYM
ncbi:nitrogenase component 1 [Flammeovirgaceae bacterium SG7u.111]|nr:nitrogenase component 1 [Flammeovirgaceae bacterium SG7u.132]WPO37577.1 nitrogenase component 1 [Flammeovirgaceae bacterium SG7u.111]